MHTLTPMNARTHILPLLAPPKDKAGWLSLEIDEVTTGAWLSTGMSPPTEGNYYLTFLPKDSYVCAIRQHLKFQYVRIVLVNFFYR